MDDPLVGAYKQFSGGSYEKLYYLTDGRGRLLSFTAENGDDRLLDYRYTDGGNQAGAIDNSSSFANGRGESDQAPNLSFYRSRYYDQITGRFLTEDPIGIAGGANLYQYSGNNPATYTDPFGLCPWCRSSVEIAAGVLARVAIRGRAEGRDVVIAFLDATETVRTGGTRSWRNNNPGNIRNTGFSRGQGSVGEAGGFAIFGHESTGQGALVNLLSSDAYSSLSLNAAISRYAPASENNTQAYQAFVQTSTGISGSAVLGTLDPTQVQSLAQAIRTMEGWRVGTVSQRPWTR